MRMRLRECVSERERGREYNQTEERKKRERGKEKATVEFGAVEQRGPFRFKAHFILSRWSERMTFTRDL